MLSVYFSKLITKEIRVNKWKKTFKSLPVEHSLVLTGVAESTVSSGLWGSSIRPALTKKVSKCFIQIQLLPISFNNLSKSDYIF